jgi:hypothetical protein
VQRCDGGSTTIVGFGNYNAPPLTGDSVRKELNCRRIVNNRKPPRSMGVVLKKKKDKAEMSDDTGANDKVQRLKKAAAAAAEAETERSDGLG